MFNNINLNNKIENIIHELNNQIYADRHTLKKELISFSNLLKNKSLKDKTPEEIIIELFNEVIEQINLFFKKYNFVPGMNITSKINDIVVNFSMGDTDYTKKEKLDFDTMFDIASISKTPTAIIMYQLIEEQLINNFNKVKDILVEYDNLPQNLLIQDLLNYRGKYFTEGRIDDAPNKIEALKRLKNVILEEESLDMYNYNDIVPMLCGEISKRVTNKSLIDLVNERIVSPLKLKNIVFNNNIDSSRLNQITGTPNKSRGLCNDPKANILEGYPGGAGLFCSTNDIICVLENLLKGNLFETNLQDFYTKNPLKINRGVAGQSIIPTKSEKKGYYSNLSPIISLGEDGSTRTIATSGKYVLNKENYYVSGAVFTNPCSSNPEIIQYHEKRNNKSSGNYYKYFDNIDAYRVDVREILPSSSLDDILFSLQKFNLRITLLCEYIKSYEKNYKLNKTINLKYKRGE